MLICFVCEWPDGATKMRDARVSVVGHAARPDARSQHSVVRCLRLPKQLLVGACARIRQREKEDRCITMVDVEDDGAFDGEIRRKVTRKTFKIEEVSPGSKIWLFRARRSDDRIFSR